MSVPHLGSIATGTAVALTGSIISSDHSFRTQLPIALVAGALTTMTCMTAARNLPPDSRIMRTANWIKPAVVAYTGTVGATAAILRRGESAGAWQMAKAPEVGAGMLAAIAVVGTKGAIAALKPAPTDSV